MCPGSFCRTCPLTAEGDTVLENYLWIPYLISVSHIWRENLFSNSILVKLYELSYLSACVLSEVAAQERPSAVSFQFYLAKKENWGRLYCSCLS